MEFAIALVDVLATCILMFSLARTALLSMGESHGWIWIGFVFILAITNMLLHRQLGTTVNPPFYAALWFCVTLFGIDPPTPSKTAWPKRGVYAVVIGTIVGWLSYAQIVEI